MALEHQPTGLGGVGGDRRAECGDARALGGDVLGSAGDQRVTDGGEVLRGRVSERSDQGLGGGDLRTTPGVGAGSKRSILAGVDDDDLEIVGQWEEGGSEVSEVDEHGMPGLSADDGHLIEESDVLAGETLSLLAQEGELDAPLLSAEGESARDEQRG